MVVILVAQTGGRGGVNSMGTPPRAQCVRSGDAVYWERTLPNNYNHLGQYYTASIRTLKGDSVGDADPPGLDTGPNRITFRYKNIEMKIN